MQVSSNTPHPPKDMVLYFTRRDFHSVYSVLLAQKILQMKSRSKDFPDVAARSSHINQPGITDLEQICIENVIVRFSQWSFKGRSLWCLEIRPSKKKKH